MTGESLRSVLEAAVVELEGTSRTERDGDLELAIAGIPFAVIQGEGAEFRLAPPVAAAALRTPDTSPSPRGRGWVAFRPVALDQHAVDRARAWLASAWRRADGES